MRKVVAYFIFWLFPLLPGSTYAHFNGEGHVHTISETKQVYSNPDCHATDSCDLKRFSLTTLVYEVWFRDDPIRPTYGTGVIMEYETNTVPALEKYAIVQFKKGCVFHTSKNGAGKVERNITDVVPSFGERIPFCFPGWVIDSHDSDPAYNSDPEYGRFYLLRWNKPGSYDRRTQKFYGMQKPKKPVVYMTDYPAGAFITGTGVKNVALEFKTCIYKAIDVPRATHRLDISFGEPLTCFDWQNVYIYDFDKATFQTSLAAAPKWEEPSEPAKAPQVQVLPPFLILLALATLSLLIVGYRRFRSARS